MRTDTFLPRCGRFPLWSRWDAMPFEDVAHGLGTDRQAQRGQGTDDPIIAPGAILLGHADNQGLQLRVNRGAAGSLTLCGAVKLLRHKSPVPGQDGVRFDDGSDFLESLLLQLRAEVRQRLALAVCQPHTTRNLVT